MRGRKQLEAWRNLLSLLEPRQEHGTAAMMKGMHSAHAQRHCQHSTGPYAESTSSCFALLDYSSSNEPLASLVFLLHCMIPDPPHCCSRQVLQSQSHYNHLFSLRKERLQNPVPGGGNVEDWALSGCDSGPSETTTLEGIFQGAEMKRQFNFHKIYPPLDCKENLEAVYSV